MTAQPYTIDRNETLGSAHEMMEAYGIRHLPVLDHAKLVGVVTQRDLYFLESIAGTGVAKDDVSDAMSRDTYAVPPEASISDVVATMTERRLGCAVVAENGRVAGIFTATDALRLLGVLLKPSPDPS